jgi:hypothetical protein
MVERQIMVWQLRELKVLNTEGYTCDLNIVYYESNDMILEYFKFH